MKRWTSPALVILSFSSACAASGPVVDPTASASLSIQGGIVDTTHTFAVGIVQLSQLQNNEVAFCSGVLVAENLVATARHCVAQLASPQIDCATSTFGGLVPVSEVLVTADTDVTPQSAFTGVSDIIVPDGEGDDKVCGNDIALLILSKSISLPQYAVPAISPPITDHAAYSTNVTVIGYGIDTPADEAGTSAGVRRIKENVALVCIPGDTAIDCSQDPSTMGALTQSEFLSSNGSTCEGDSGSGAFDQSDFDRGQWVALGVLSRGGVSSDNTTCTQPIYERFDAWGPLLVAAANEASARSGAPPPEWASMAIAADAASPVPSSDSAPSAEPADGAPAEGGTPVSKGMGGGSDACSVALGAAPVPTADGWLHGVALSLVALTRAVRRAVVVRRRA